MEDPMNILEVLEPASMNASNVAHNTLESVVKFLQDERKNFVSKAGKYVSRVAMPQTREWSFNWFEELAQPELVKECKRLLAFQKKIEGFSPREEIKRFRLFGHSSCNMTLEKAMTQCFGHYISPLILGIHIFHGNSHIQDILPKVVKLEGEMFSPPSQLRGISQFQSANIIFEEVAHCVRLWHLGKVNAESLHFINKIHEVNDALHGGP